MLNVEILKRLRDRTVTDVSDATATGGAPDEPVHESSAGRVGMWALIIGLTAFLLWAGFAPLDEGVPAPAVVSIDTKRKPVQHLSGGLVKEVLVREGDEVKDGQVLIRLDNAVAKANFEASRQRYLNLRAVQGRLLAEQSGQNQITYHPDLIAAGSDPLVKQQMVNQDQLFQSRRAGLRADLQSLEEGIQGQEALSVAYESMLVSRRSQLASLSEELKNTREMVKEGYAPRNRQLELERNVAESNASIAELTGNLARGRRAIGEFRQRMISRQQDFRKEVEGQLSDVGREVLSEVEKYAALQNDLDRTEIKSPTAGQVVGLIVQTPGSVIQPGQRLMDIVPMNEPLLLEAHVAPQMIDRVHAGLPVDIRFTNFAHSPQLVVKGQVISISKDMLNEPQSNVGYYLARVAVTPDGMKELGQRHLQSGMPSEVVFKTGERSMLTYLLSPLMKRLAASMKEE